MIVTAASRRISIDTEDKVEAIINKAKRCFCPLHKRKAIKDTRSALDVMKVVCPFSCWSARQANSEGHMCGKKPKEHVSF